MVQIIPGMWAITLLPTNGAWPSDPINTTSQCWETNYPTYCQEHQRRAMQSMLICQMPVQNNFCNLCKFCIKPAVFKAFANYRVKSAHLCLWFYSSCNSNTQLNAAPLLWFPLGVKHWINWFMKIKFYSRNNLFD